MVKKQTKPQPLSAEERQKALDGISGEELAKIEQYQASSEGSYSVDPEWLILAEVARVYGWQAFLDVKNDARDEEGNLLITTHELMTLLAANRKLEFLELYKDAHASFIGSVSAQSRKPDNTFKSLTKDILNKSKADE